MAAADFAYSAQDVAQALARLSQVTAARGLVFAEGTPAVLDAQDIQARWQHIATVAGGAGDGTLDPVTLEHLRAIYNHIEAVIISCGAPDAFDVYEACFECLSKAGLFLPGLQSRQLLLQVLEDVHEVYDVLLSCVETYEWVQPGATGMLRLWMMQILFAGLGCTTITGRDLMELTDNDVCGAISLIAFIIKCEQAPYEMQAAAGRCLVELTTADCVFFQQTDSEETNTQQITKLTAMLNRHVNGLIRGIIQFEIVEAFGHCICQHQLTHARTDVIVKNFMTTIHNCLCYCSENQKKLRQHLATQSTIVQDIMVPYVYNILPALFDKAHCGPNDVEWQNMKSVLQTFVVVTFNINVFRPQLRDSDLLCKVCEVPNILAHISMLELIIKILINVDYVKGPHAELLLATMHGAFERLPQESRDRLQRRMCSEQGIRLPYSRSAAQAVQSLAWVLTPPAGDAGQTTEEKKARRKNNWRSSKNKNRKRKRMFGMQKTGKAGAAEAVPFLGTEEGDQEGESEDDEDDMPPLMPAENWEASLGQTDETGVPSMAKCQLTGGLMHDPVRTPDGYLFERAVLEDWVLVNHSNPLTGQPLQPLEIASATDVASFIQGYQLQMLSACTIAPEAFDEPLQPEVAAPTPAVQMPAAAPIAPASPSGMASLGDLPSLQKEQPSPKSRKEKAKIRITSRSVVDCPDDMRCALDGKVMTSPQRSPYGHCFEKKTLEKWVMNCGSICPITQQPLRLEDCQPDAEMKKRIVKFLKGQA